MKKVTPLICITLVPAISGFGIPPSVLHDAANSVSPFLDHATTVSSSSVVEGKNVLDLYKQVLQSHPLPTKMITGGSLAVVGDFLAQSKVEDEEYDKRRAFSFMSFDMCYRALQHVSFPVIVQQCQGQYIGGAIASLPLLANFVDKVGWENPAYYFGAMEQTLASQLGIVPFMYYPVFYVLTAFVQGLTADEAVTRAKETFIPLMKRNLLFWIPVQFIQFGFIDESLQIPFLSVAGLAWTFIISLFAGNAKKVSNESENTEIEAVAPINSQDMKEIEKAIIAHVEKESAEEKNVVVR